ncbi:MAG: Dyp-type peroxidase [Bowdeniella nasicola]|nr:Dyp-type peroxidase [Bowdeniella nasicola]
MTETNPDIPVTPHDQPQQPDIPDQQSTTPAGKGVKRRSLLFAAGGAALGAAATWGWGALSPDILHRRPAAGENGAHSGVGNSPGAGAGPYGNEQVACHGAHQAGIITPPQGFLVLTAYRLVAGIERIDVQRLLKLWSEDIEFLTAGYATYTDTEPELSHLPASLTITVGFGPGLFDKLNIADQRPTWLQQLPPYSIDQLDEQWCGGDLVVQVCSDDPITTAHAARLLAKEAAAYATPQWTQHGSRNAPGVTLPGATMRNHFGQLDGTRNPKPQEEPNLIFRSGGPAWLNGGSTMVVRRIHMNLDSWDELDIPARDVVLGRRQSTGAPLTGEQEFDEPDLEAKNALGFPVIDTAAHIRRARTDDGSQRIFRRPYNYVDNPRPGEISNVGLVFIAFQADLEHQYLPLQQQLADLDLLNQWTTPVGSAVFAIPRGFQPGEYLGQDLI